MFSLDFLHLSLIFNVLHEKKYICARFDIRITAIPRKIKAVLLGRVMWKSNLNSCKIPHGFWIVVTVFFSFNLHLLPHFSQPGSSCCQALFQSAGKKQMDKRVTSFCSSSQEHSFSRYNTTLTYGLLKPWNFQVCHLLYVLVLSIVTYLIPFRFSYSCQFVICTEEFSVEFRETKTKVITIAN